MGGRLNLLFLGLGLLIAIGGGVGALATWWTRGRDPEVGPVAEFIPDPPDNLPPGVIGALLDEQVDQRDIVATLVDLGQRGVLRIDRTEGQGIFGRGGDFTLTALQDEPKVARFERELLEALFGSKVKSGEQVSLSEVKGRFAAAQPQIQRHLYDELVERGYFTTSPERTRGRWKSIGMFALIVAIIGGCVAIGSLADIAPTIFIPIAALVGDRPDRRVDLALHAAQDPRRRRGGGEVAGVPKLSRLDRALRKARRGAGHLRSLPAVRHRVWSGELLGRQVLARADRLTGLVWRRCHDLSRTVRRERLSRTVVRAVRRRDGHHPRRWRIRTVCRERRPGGRATRGGRRTLRRRWPVLEHA